MIAVCTNVSLAASLADSDDSFHQRRGAEEDILILQTAAGGLYCCGGAPIDLSFQALYATKYLADSSQ